MQRARPPADCTAAHSTGGGHLADDPDPPHDWLRQTLRVLHVSDNQVRALRKRQAVGGVELGHRAGAYWGIRSDVADYELPDAVAVPPAAALWP